MEFKIPKNLFIKALAKTISIAEKNIGHVLSNILIEGDKDTITFKSTDLEIALIQQYPISLLKKGCVVVSARKLYDIIKEFPDKDIDVAVDERFKMELVSGKTRIRLNGIEPSEFPKIPEYKKDKFFKLETDSLLDMIEKTVFATSNNETKRILNGVYFEKIMREEKKFIRMIATDGHRLSIMDKEVENWNKINITEGVIIPKKGLNELKRICEDEASEVSFNFVDNNFVVIGDNTTLSMRLLQGGYPNYQQVIPKRNENTMIVNRVELINALKRMSSICSLTDEFKKVLFTVEGSKLSLYSKSPELGEANEEFDVEYIGMPLEVSFNSKFFIEALNVMNNAEKVRIKFGDKETPALLYYVNSAEYLHLIMPLRS